MGRQKKPRYCRGFAGFNLFKPSGIPLSQLQSIEIALDELEAMRLCDLEGHDQAQAALEMEISRGTIQRLLYSGRQKLISVIIYGKALVVQDSSHVIIRGLGHGMRHGRRRHG